MITLDGIDSENMNLQNSFGDVRWYRQWGYESTWWAYLQGSAFGWNDIVCLYLLRVCVRVCVKWFNKTSNKVQGGIQSTSTTKKIWNLVFFEKPLPPYQFYARATFDAYFLITGGSSFLWNESSFLRDPASHSGKKKEICVRCGDPGHTWVKTLQNRVQRNKTFKRSSF